MRRDFPTLLALIRAHAGLHQLHRERDEHGRIVANLDDYAIMRDLVVGAMSEGVSATVSATTRATVVAASELLAAKPEHGELRVRELAAKLNLDESSASRRIQVCIRNGYLRNLEDKPGRRLPDGSWWFHESHESSSWSSFP